MSRFTNALVVTPLSDGGTWVLIKPFGYDVGEEGSADKIDVAVGFMTDFASIPRPFWAILPRWGRYGNAAVLHDWLYWTQQRPRPAADKIMLEAMTVLTVPAWEKYPIYWSVRAFGWFSWKRNQWDRATGFDRILRQTQIKSTTESGRVGFLRAWWRQRKLPAGNACGGR
jgi:hypothetical protein